jgi:hypothetical protein
MSTNTGEQRNPPVQQCDITATRARPAEKFRDQNRSNRFKLKRTQIQIEENAEMETDNQIEDEI